ncbi:MAG: lipopolysaccharide heptosyltransferase II [Candidatus Aminicenantes bacterium]
MNIVIRSPNWIGDCVMCLPAIRALKANCPDANIYLAVKQSLCPVYKNVTEIKEIIPLPDNIDFRATFKVASQLKKYRFDYGILFTNSFHSAFLFRLAGIKKLIGYERDLRGWLLRQKLKFPRDNRHHIYFYLGLAAAFIEKTSGGKIGKNYSHQLMITDPEREEVSAVLRTLGVDLSNPLLGISSSAAYGSAKEWLPERFTELILRLHQKKSPDPVEILLFGSAKEREKIAKIAAGGDSLRVHNLAGQLNLRQAIVAISFCCLFISNDSGLMHVASAFNLPLIALFGPTRPHKTGPLNKNARVLYHPVACSPCLYRDCPLNYDNHACMKTITVDEVLAALRQLGGRLG